MKKPTTWNLKAKSNQQLLEIGIYRLLKHRNRAKRRFNLWLKLRSKIKGRKYQRKMYADWYAFEALLELRDRL